jgi:hypothetical protein
MSDQVQAPAQGHGRRKAIFKTDLAGAPVKSVRAIIRENGNLH